MIRERDTLLYGGKRFRVEVTKAEQPPHNRVSIEDDIIHVSMLGNEDPEAILRIWLTAKTKTLVNRIICSHASQFQAKPSDVAIRNTRRWGYCTRKGRLVFNWQLAALPREIAEYVIIHEYSHLSKFNHQKGFHKTLARIFPDYRKREKELKRYIPIKDAEDANMSAKRVQVEGSA